ncbi:hypothetical protein ACRAWD_19385 [Caulobacter segnis]
MLFGRSGRLEGPRGLCRPVGRQAEAAGPGGRDAGGRHPGRSPLKNWLVLAQTYAGQPIAALSARAG